jgi:hypothetical protein
MTNEEAMKLALEALNKLTDAAEGFSVSGVYFNEGVWEKECLNTSYAAIKALEEALAKQEQGEPVAEYIGNNPDELDLSKRIGLIHRLKFIPLRSKLYTTPQQRTWVDLDDDDRHELWESIDSDWELMKRVEAKLKEKNT